jgi:hypothetical protein
MAHWVFHVLPSMAKRRDAFQCRPCHAACHWGVWRRVVSASGALGVHLIYPYQVKYQGRVGVHRGVRLSKISKIQSSA